MFDALQKAKWWNNPVRNKTQTSYLRFIEQPYTELTSSFTKSIERFDKFMKRRETVYERFLGSLGEPQ